MKAKTNHFAPIAIVGQSCVLPGALDPAAFWENVREGRDLITEASADHWRLSRLEEVLAQQAIGSNAANAFQDRAASRRSGVVEGFAAAFAALLRDSDDAGQLRGLDVVFQWLLYCGRQALKDAGLSRGDLFDQPDLRAGVIVGNLSYPTAAFNELYESLALEQAGFENVSGRRPAPENRFMSGLPAHWLAQRLGCRGDAFALDAACASSLFALKLACDRLHDGAADVMLAGAINAADDLFLHIGFTALQALSPAGRSRPFHREADGLVPAQGAALFVLKTLDRALRDGDRILGVIRGIGLSNDGRSRGFLAPAQGGQAAAMRSAYSMAGLRPADISMVECHATGTAVGDETEIRSMSEVFAGCSGVPIGSLKSNLGHLITASGAAGLMKVLKSFEHGVRPATLHVDPRAQLDQLNGSPFRVLAENETYERDGGGPRRAAVSSFGFGGNNGHLIVEEWREEAPFTPAMNGAQSGASAAPGTDSEIDTDPVALIAMGAQVGDLDGVEAFRTALFEHRPPTQKAVDQIPIDLKAVPFPPRDLEQTLGQQLLMLKVSADALADLGSPLDAERTGVFVGMQCDTEIARYSLRWRLGDLFESHGIDRSKATPAARNTIVPALEAAGVIGRMPNIPANRLNACYDFRGPSFTVSAEELSGIRALELAVRSLGRGEIDAAVVGAVDLSCEPVHAAVAKSTGGANSDGGSESRQQDEPGDAAIVFICKRLPDALRAGDEIHALIETGSLAAKSRVRPDRPAPRFDVNLLFGHAHAARGLLTLAAAVLATRHGAQIGGDGKNGRRAMPGLYPSQAEPRTLTLGASGEQRATIAIAAHGPRAGYRADGAAGLQVFSGRDSREIIGRLESASPPDPVRAARTILAPNAEGRARLALVIPEGRAGEYRRTAVEALRRYDRNQDNGAARARVDDAMIAPGIYFRPRPLAGELAFAFTGAASAYPGMGRELLLALPELHESLAAKFKFSDLTRFVGWAYADESAASPIAAGAFQQLCGSSYLCQIHARLSRETLGLEPDAVLGLSSGETNSLLAMDVWGDMEDFLGKIEASGMYDRELAGEFAAVQRYRAKHGLPGTDWSDWRLLAPVERVRDLLKNEAGVRLTIINTDEDCVIGGASDACGRVIAAVGEDLAIPLGHGMAVHCPEVGDFEATWRDLHHRETRSPAGSVRFYSNHFDGGAYTPDADRAAEALTGNALHTIDFPRIIERAYADGVRIFVEHGPRGLLNKWIGRILGDREHCAVSFDAPGDSLARSYDAVARLLVHGVALDYETFAVLDPEPVRSSSATFMKTFAAHPAPVRIDRDLPMQRPGAATAESSSDRGRLVSAADVGAGPKGAAVKAALKVPVKAAMGITMKSNGVSNGSEQFMEPAPVLARTDISDGVKNKPVVARAFGGDSRQTPAERRGEKNAHFSAFTDEMARLTAHHAEFLRQQHALHARFLQMNQALLAGFSPRPHAADGSPAGPRAFEENPASRLLDESPPSGDLRDDADRVSEDTGAPPVSPDAVAPPRGLTFDRTQLEIHAGGRISEIFGELFERQDDFARQVRMPEPPLLLADRVTGLDAEAGSMGRGTVWTETDVRADAWYLNAGRMPAGVMIESGQADLFLISYLGVDFLNRGERVYRLLGCELTYRGRLPAVNETLRYDIHVDGHAAQGDIRLFFFHYDCRVGDETRLSVRNGQAGFFTDEELADSGGILWEAATGEYDATARLDAPAIQCTREAFSKERLRAFSEGDLYACFGEGFEYCQTHVRPPKIQSGRMLFLDEVTRFDPLGGPWGRGYLRARSELKADDWFFAGHFKNDPCMPGTLMFEGCLQAMAFYLAGLGYTVTHDGWLFEPVPDETYKLMCRGQATPASREIVYEIFVEEVHAGPMPTLFADLLCTIDGRKAFHARRMGLRLVPDWPLTSRPALLENFRDPVPVAQAGGISLGYASLLACAWGPPSDAFGEMYRRFDGPRTVPRLPGPPYHFMSRVTKVAGEIGELKEGARVEIEYDVPPADEWYFAGGAMPFAVLLEAALQPCGWLASYVGSTLTTDDAIFFRNLDGSAKLLAEIKPRAGVFRTAVELTSISQSGPMIIQSFDVRCFLNDEPIYEMQTVFGFFPAEALANQVGLSVNDAERERCFSPSDFCVDLTERPARYFRAALRLPDSMLCMLDRVTGYWAGESGTPVARLRGEKDVYASEWFFKAHFFQDPVQPGSLGLEALLQLLQFYMIHEGLDEGVARPRFEVIQLNQNIAWKYRGQVVPKNKLITSELEVLEVGRDEHGPFARAQGWLWVDGKRIYHFTDFGLRIVEDPEAPRGLNGGEDSGPSHSKSKAKSNADERAGLTDSAQSGVVFALDPQREDWLADHCPTYTIPVLPMMSMLDGLVGVARGSMPSASSAVASGKSNLNSPAPKVSPEGPRRGFEPPLRLADLALNRWVAFDVGERKLRLDLAEATVARLSVWRDAEDARFSRFDSVAMARIESVAPADAESRGGSARSQSDSRPQALQALAADLKIESPYVSGAMFHGPAFQYLIEVREDLEQGAASGILDAEAGRVPYGNLHQGLLDAGTHIIPADRLHEWSRAIQSDQVAYPARILRADVFEALPPVGRVRVEARLRDLAEFAETPGLRYPVFRLQWILADATRGVERVAIEADLAYALFPKGTLGSAAPGDRRAFLRDREYVPGLGLSKYDPATGETRICYDDVRASDWLSGTVAAVYRTDAQSNDTLCVEIAAKDHLARMLRTHPSRIQIDVGRGTGRADRLPYNTLAFRARVEGEGAERVTIVRGSTHAPDADPIVIDADLSRDAWRERLKTDAWPGEPLIFGLIQKFVRRFVVEDPEDFARLRGRGVLYLGNHQVGIESILFAILAGACAGVPLKTIAKIQHKESYVGRLIDCFMSYPGVRPPESIIYFDEEQPATFFDHLAEFRRGAETEPFSLMVHAEGSRAYSAKHKVTILSSVLVDFAIEMDFPIVPVWFAGGLPIESQTERIEFPCGYGSQDYYLGASISPGELSALPGRERVARVLAGINATGPAADAETPNPPDPLFAERVAAVQIEAQIGEVAAVMRTMLESLADPGPEIKHILAVLAREDATPAALASSEFSGDEARLAWMRKVAAYLTEV